MGIIKLFNHLRKNKVERALRLQLLRSGTSISANVEEALGESSRKDFIHKLEIAYSEAEKQIIGWDFLRKAICWKLK